MRFAIRQYHHSAESTFGMTRCRRILVTTAVNKMADGEEATSGSEEFRREVRDCVRHCIMSIMREQELHISENGNLENLQQRLEWLLSVVIRYHGSNFIEQGIVDIYLLSEALACLSYSWEEANSAMAERIFRVSGKTKIEYFV